MGQYRIRYVTYAGEQLRQMPPLVRTAFDSKIEDLKRDPYAAGDYDTSKGSFTTIFADTGIIMYTASDESDAVTVLRIFWSEW